MRKLVIFIIITSWISLIFSLCSTLGQYCHSPRGPPIAPPTMMIGAVTSLLRSKFWKRFQKITIGHTDATMSLGLHDESIANDNTTESDVTTLDQAMDEVLDGDEDTENESEHIIHLDEMNHALTDAKQMMVSSHEDILAQGWKLVHQNEHFALYKRRQKRSSGDGPVEYVMKGQFLDVSPRTFLLAQIDCSLRKLWDKTMKEMSKGQIALDEDCKEEGSCSGKVRVSKDKLYFRTKWPWPMKDRDYALARRCKIFHNDSAIVFISKSHDSVSYPAKDGALRVDNYWCHSTFLSLPSDSSLPPSATQNPEQNGHSDLDNQWEEDNSLERGESNGGEQIDTEEMKGRPHLHYNTLRLIDQFQHLQKQHANYLKSIRIHPVYRRYQEQFLKRLQVKQRMLSRQLCLLQTKLLVGGDQLEESESRLYMENNDADHLSEDSNSNSNAVEAEEVQETRKKRIRNRVCKPGMQFVTIFCDDQKVPLHPKIVDMIASHAEKVVPGSIEKLYQIAREVEAKKILVDTDCSCNE